MLKRLVRLSFALAICSALVHAAAAPEDLMKKAKTVLAPIAGDITLPGLKEPVEVLRDRWGIAHIYFLIGLRHRLGVALSWLWIYLRDQRPARLITQGSSKVTS